MFRSRFQRRESIESATVTIILWLIRKVKEWRDNRKT